MERQQKRYKHEAKTTEKSAKVTAWLTIVPAILTFVMWAGDKFFPDGEQTAPPEPVASVEAYPTGIKGAASDIGQQQVGTAPMWVPPEEEDQLFLWVAIGLGVVAIIGWVVAYIQRKRREDTDAF